MCGERRQWPGSATCDSLIPPPGLGTREREPDTRGSTGQINLAIFARHPGISRENNDHESETPGDQICEFWDTRGTGDNPEKLISRDLLELRDWETPRMIVARKLSCASLAGGHVPDWPPVVLADLLHDLLGSFPRWWAWVSRNDENCDRGRGPNVTMSGLCSVPPDRSLDYNGWERWNTEHRKLSTYISYSNISLPQ